MSVMKLELANSLQVEIADLMWQAQSLKDTQLIIDQYGVDGIIVREMMMAAICDEDDDVDLAKSILDKF